MIINIYIRIEFLLLGFSNRQFWLLFYCSNFRVSCRNSRPWVPWFKLRKHFWMMMRSRDGALAFYVSIHILSQEMWFRIIFKSSKRWWFYLRTHSIMLFVMVFSVIEVNWLELRKFIHKTSLRHLYLLFTNVIYDDYADLCVLL